MRDIIFLALVIGFFALAVLFVRGCELIIGRRSIDQELER